MLRKGMDFSKESIRKSWGKNRLMKAVQSSSHVSIVSSLSSPSNVFASHNVGNQVIQNAVWNPRIQNVGNQNGQIVVLGNANQNPNGNGNLVAARAEGNATGHNVTRPGSVFRCDPIWGCYMQQPMPNPEDITDPTTAMNMALALIAKAFKLNYSTPTNNNQRISSNPRNKQIAQPGMNMGQDRQMQMVGGNANQNLNRNGNLVAARAEDLDEIEKVNTNCILMANLKQASTSGTQTDKAPVYDSDGSAEVHNYEDCYDNEIFNMFTQEEQYTELLEPIPEPHQVPQNDNNVISEVFSVEQSRRIVEQHPANIEETRVLYDSLYNNLAIEVEKVNTVNLKLSETIAELTSELARYKNQEKCFEISQEKYDKLERCYQKSVYQEQCLSKQINALHLNSGKQIMTLNEEISDLNKLLSVEKSTISSLLEEKNKFKSDFKIREDKFLDKQIQLEKKIKELDNILVKTSQSIQTIHMLSPKPDSFYHTELKMALETLQLAQESRQKMKLLNKEIKPANYTKINHLSWVFVSQMAKSREELYFSNTSKTVNVSKPISIPNEEFSDDTTPSVAQKFLNEVKITIVTLQGVVKQRMTLDTHNWSSSAHQELHKIVKDENFPIVNQVDARVQNLKIQFLKESSKFVGDFKSLSKEADESLAKHKALELEIKRLLRAVVSEEDTACGTSANTKFAKQSILGKLPKVITPEMFMITPFKPSREEKHVPNKVRASIMINPITVSQPPVITKKVVNSDSNGLSSTGVDNTKTRRLQPRSNTKNDRVPSVSKSSCRKNKEVDVKEHHRKLLLSRKKKHMSSECNNVKLATQNVKSKVVCAMCKQCLISVNHYVCLLNYVNGMTSRGKKQKENVSINKNQKKQKSKVKKPKKVRSIERLASPKPSKPRSFLRWSPTGRLFNLKGKIIASSESESQSDCSKGDNASIATACFTQNRSIIHRRFNKIPYELINDRKPDISFLYVFEALFYPKNDREDIGKLGAKGDIGFFIGYSADSCSFRVYNRRAKKIMETMNVSFDELSAMAFEQRSLKPGLQSMTSGQISLGLDLTYAPSTITTQQPIELSIMEPKNVKEAMTNHAWIESMQEELLQFKSLDVWVLVPAPDNITPLTLKWLFKNKHDEEKTVIQNKSRLVVRGYRQEEGIDFEESFAPLLEWKLSGYFWHMQHINHSLCFIDADHPSHVFKLKKALYGLKQASRAWYDEFSMFLLQNHFFKGTTDPTLFIRRFVDDILVVYVDDIIFGSTHHRYTQLFFDLMKSRFEMSMMGEMTFFLGLQVNQSPCGIFINQSNYVLEIPRKYGMESCEPVGTPMEIKDKLDLDQNRTPVDGTKYHSMIDADYAGCKDTFKSTSGGAQFLGEKLVSWSSKKQDCTALSTMKAKYVSLSACCAQVLWIWTQLTDYGFYFNKIPIYCYSKSAIAISCNPVQHSRTKHIIVRYHFIKEHVEKGTIELYFIKTDYQLADLFTKALPVDRFNYLVRRLGIRSLSHQELDRLANLQ
nr:hypothetical protein [Tanacetum cinerariifolium]